MRIIGITRAPIVIRCLNVLFTSSRLLTANRYYRSFLAKLYKKTHFTVPVSHSYGYLTQENGIIQPDNLFY